MQTWKDLTQIEKNEVISRAWLYEQEHRMYTREMASFADFEYPPSGSDLFNPLLWKSGHWAWYYRGEE